MTGKEPTAGAPARVHAHMARGLDALAELINEALARMGTPAFATAGPLGPSVAHQTSLDTTLGQPAGGLTGRRPRPGNGTAARPPEDETPTAAGGTGQVETEHVEIWHLVRKAQEGDGEAFGALYDRYVDTVFRFIYYRVNDRALAEDFTSETFLRALRRIGSISYQGRDVGAWFITIARNIVFDHTKSARHRLEVTTADTVESREQAESTESAVLSTLDSEHLMAAVAKLGDEQRECVMLRFIQGMSVAETAAIMGKNDGAVKALQHRAVRKLAELVGPELR